MRETFGDRTDLLVHVRSPAFMDVPVEKLADLKPVFTLVGGKIAYESPDL